MVLTLVPTLLVIVLLLPWYHHLAINIVAVIVSVIGAYEAANFFAAKGYPTPRFLIPILGAALPITAYLEISGFVPVETVIQVVVGLSLLVMLREAFVLREQEFARILPRIAVSLTVLIYPGLLMTYIVRFSALPNPSLSLVVFLLMVFANDSFAYLAGSLWGKDSRRVLPVSPNKSVVGFIGGIAGTFIIAVGTWYAFPFVFHGRLALMIVAAACVAVMTILGDLVESAMKRSSDLKDSGFVIPGRGGILDSIDSILFAAPVCFYLLARAAGI